MRRPPRPGFTLVELLVVIGITGVLVGLLMAAVQRVRAAATRATCQNNMRQIGLALHSYAGTAGALPPGHLPHLPSEPFPDTGWPLAILPHIEQDAVYRQAVRSFGTSRAWSDATAHPGFTTVLAAYGCPSDGRTAAPQIVPRYGFQAAMLSYLGVCGADAGTPTGVLYPGSKTRFADVTDGTSQTLLVGERPPGPDVEFSWWYAGVGQDGAGSAEHVMGVRETNVSPLPELVLYCTTGPYHFTDGRPAGYCDVFHFWSFHPGGANFVFCDGSVRFVRYEADPILPALATRAGGEVAAPPD